MTKLQKQLSQINACTDAVNWAAKFNTLQQAWNACKYPGWMAWIATHDDFRLNGKKLRDSVSSRVWDIVDGTRTYNAFDKYRYKKKLRKLRALLTGRKSLDIKVGR